jgi:acyl dehydratase
MNQSAACASVKTSAIEREALWTDVEWTSDDALLYAVAIGAGHDDPCQELSFTTENSLGIQQRVLPTFAATVLYNAQTTPVVLGSDRTKRLHASQSLTVHRSVPVSGRARVRSYVAGIHDHGWGAMVVYQSEAIDSESGNMLFEAQTTTFVKGETRCGTLPPRIDWSVPQGPPAIEHVVATRPEQALLYRLCGDRNQLHSDPQFARRCGFRQPILHGLCTYGIACRVLLRRLADSDPDRFVSMSGRFTRRVVPGELLTIVAWGSINRWVFRVVNGKGAVVLDEGTLVLRAKP